MAEKLQNILLNVCLRHEYSEYYDMMNTRTMIFDEIARVNEKIGTRMRNNAEHMNDFETRR